jgi:hypothetical protein
VKKLLLASVFAVLALPREPLPSLSAEAFDWDRYCSDDYGCDARKMESWIMPAFVTAIGASSPITKSVSVKKAES